MATRIRKPQGARELIIDPGGVLTVYGDIIIEDGGRVMAKPGGSIADNLAELTPQKGQKASLTTALEVADAELVFTAKSIGGSGNEIKVEYLDPEEENAEVTVEVADNVISVKLVPGDGGAITTTANDIIAAFASNDLVTVTKKGGNAGTGIVTAMEALPLIGGKDTTPAKKGDLFFDGTNIYIAIADIKTTDTGADWHKVAHATI